MLLQSHRNCCALHPGVAFARRVGSIARVGCLSTHYLSAHMAQVVSCEIGRCIGQRTSNKSFNASRIARLWTKGSVGRCQQFCEREFQRCSITLAVFQADIHTDDVNCGTRSGLLPMYEGCRPERQNLVALITESLENEVRSCYANQHEYYRTSWESMGLGAFPSRCS